MSPIEEIEGKSPFTEQLNKQLVEITKIVSDNLSMFNHKIDLFIFDSVRSYASKFVNEELETDFNEEIFKFCLDVLEANEVFVVVEMDERGRIDKYDIKTKSWNLGSVLLKVSFLFPDDEFWRGEEPHHHIRRIIR